MDKWFQNADLVYTCCGRRAWHSSVRAASDAVLTTKGSERETEKSHGMWSSSLTIVLRYGAGHVVSCLKGW